MSRSKWTSDLDFELLLERFPLAAWLARRGFSPQGRAKAEWIADCPFCGAKDKLSVNPQRRRWRCFVCRRGFTLLDLIAAFEGGSYAAAIEVVRAAAGGRSLAMIPEEWSAPTPVQRPPDWEPWPISPPPYFEPLFSHHPYTARRGLDLANLLRLGTGICTWGRYQDRLVFPVRRLDGSWIYYQSRATWEKSEHVPTTPKDKYRKNLNPPNSDPTRFAGASDVLLGLEHVQLGRYTRVALVEGPTDWVQSGPDAVALFGKVISDRQVELLVRAGVREIDVCLDPDAWLPPTTRAPDGREIPMDRPPPARAVCDRLAPHFLVRVVRYEAHLDPGACSVADNRARRAYAEPWGSGSRLMWIS